MVIPGQISLVPVATLKLENTFSGETIDPSQYVNDDNPVTITGATSGVTAKVVGFTAGTSDEQPLLHVAYQASGSDFETASFVDGENISANAGITHTTAYANDVVLQQLSHLLSIFLQRLQSYHPQLVQQLERVTPKKLNLVCIMLEDILLVTQKKR